jgi:hypothetical protein
MADLVESGGGREQGVARRPEAALARRRARTAVAVNSEVAPIARQSRIGCVAERLPVRSRE